MTRRSVASIPCMRDVRSTTRGWKTVGIAAIVGKLHDLIALIVVSQDYAFTAQNRLGSRNASVH